MPTLPKKTLKLRYLKTYDFKVSFCTGIYGGVGSNGLMNIMFFQDRMVIPDSQTLEVGEKNNILGVESEEKNGDIIRDLQFGALIDIQTAKVVANWINEQVKKYEEKKNG